MENLVPVIQYAKFGGHVEDLEEGYIPFPVPGPEELVLRIEAASLNPVDWKIQQGKYKHLNIPAKFPYSPCSDVSGEVVCIGSCVSGFTIGDKVVSYLDHKRGGGLARYAAAEAKFTSRIPDQVSIVEASGIPIAGLTALYSLEEAAGITLSNKNSRDRILITAASGGVGTYAVQLAKVAGCHVVATCGERNIQLVKSLGADEVLNYKTVPGSTFQSATCSRFDVIIHCASARLPWSTFERVLSCKGIVVDITPSSGTKPGKDTISKCTSKDNPLVPFYLTPRATGMNALLEMMQKGQLRTVIDSVHPVSNARTAWIQSMEGHATGKIVVTF